MIRRNRVLAAATAVLALGLTGACGGGDDSDSDSGGTSAKAEFNAAMTKVFNPSDKKGGTIKLANSGDWDTLDPGETYYGYSWNFLRLYGRALLTFKVEPGKGSNDLTPDLAEGLGTPSEGGKTWTYKIKPGIKYEDGTVVKAADVKYAVLRSVDKATFPNGPAYFEQFLNLPKDYKGPYKSKGVNTDSAITTPDDTTVVFHLKQAFGGFDYLAALSQTVPVPEAKDTGANYKQHVVSSGPYMFDTNNLGKDFSLKRNPNWDAASDPIRKALPDRYEVSLNVNADDLDNRLLSGDLDIDVVGTGVQPAALGRVVGDPALKANTDNPTLSRLWYTSINGTVAPFDKIDCRKAVEYAADKTGYQTAYGGPLAGGILASTLMPPQVPGYQKFDLYPSPDGKGDVEKAKAALTACGQPNGFATNIAYRAERPKEKAVAESLQQSLARVGIKLTLKPYPQGDYFSQYAGNPPYVKANKIGLATNGWGADWNDGFGFLSQIVDSRVIRETGGSSNTSVRDPEVDKMLDAAISNTDAAAREQAWGAIDKKVMEDAYILPGIHAKSLLIRPKKLTNVFVSEAYAMYDYTALGVA
ncbi:ABC transporter substrate-binding protein [Actinoplanes sp. NBRC 103695]|uniref:ABC transporter substrate-binding protein n=1 Tax=Actinoplanes sp. NBRC 103695 TaxID=3032202 RepID=UPI0024A46AF4|nr:ABC transporter substrate-binding protein [Actinoplanes sp. NBRC 103695]GLY97130.1 peptide ABC transporter substrate-binding protein [Actinoplanes sp. NBRC 103695]